MTKQMLTVEQASIKSAVVEVQVLKIGNRQVTLSVFRQLQEEPIIDAETGSLRGIPWGRVNYHVDCDDAPGRHLHVVWQKGNELRRSVVTIPGQKADMLGVRMKRYASMYLAARILEGWIPETEPGKIPRLPVSERWTVERGKATYAGRGPYPFDFEGTVLDIDVSWLWNAWERSASGVYVKDSVRAEYFGANGYYARYGELLPEDSEQIANKYLRPAIQVLGACKQSYAQLEALDQLFIAV